MVIAPKREEPRILFRGREGDRIWWFGLTLWIEHSLAV